MTSKPYFIVLLMLCLGFGFGLFPKLQAQDRTVSGTITSSEDGATLPGVSILVKNTASGTVTDIDGKYRISIPEGSETLVISSIGFIGQEIEIGNRSEIDVQLDPDVMALSEVVVTAFGIEREKKALGYSVQEIDTEALTEAREANVANSLKGRIAGLHVNPSSGGAGGSSNVVIRGSSSLTGSNQPLYVLDGVPIDNSNLDPAGNTSGRDFGDGIGNINPDDIASISVLKGPSAAALYGARGANGVILLTSKKGSRGLGVTINSNATFEEPNVLPKVQNRWGGGYGGGYGSFGTTEIDGVEYPVYGNSMYDQWGGEMDGRLIFVSNLPELGLIPYSPQPEGHIRDFYRTGSTFTNTVAVDGGTEKTTVRLSLSDMRNKHILPTTKFERQTIALNFTSAITERLTVEGRVNYIHQQGYNRPELGFGSGSANAVNSLAQLPPFVDLDWLKDHKRPDGSMRNYQQRTPHNPYWIANELLSEDKRDRIIGYLLARYQFTDWLNLQVRSGTDFYTDVRFQRTGIGTTGSSTIRGNLSNAQWSVKEENHDFLLTAAGDIFNDFTASLSVGGNHLSRHNEVIGNSGNNLIVDDVYHISNALNVSPRHSISRKKMNSIYALGQIGYKNYIFLDLTGRNDWSSTLGRNNQSFFYPSASLSFAFTDAFEVDSDFFTFGKFRASIAEAGNDASPYQTRSGYSISNNEFNGVRFASFSNRIPLLDLKNELTVSREFGVDLRFFQNRLGIDFTYYNSATKNQIVPLPISHSSGYSSRMINAGEIQNKGFELLVNSSPVRNSNGFSWDLTLNLSKNNSEVVSLVEGVESLSLLDHSYASIEARPGQPYGNIVGFKFVRNDEGQIVLNSQGRFQRTTTREILGNIQPDFLGGLTNTFSYKRLSLSALVDVRKGGQIYSHTKYRQMANGTGWFTEHREEEMIIDGVIQNEDGSYSPNTIPVDAQNYYAPRAWSNIGEDFVIDADYVALREVSLGYSFSGSLLSRTPFSSAKISMVGRNLFYIYRDPEFKKMGIAPETAFNNSSAAQGLETLALPTTRSMGFNLSISF